MRALKSLLPGCAVKYERGFILLQIRNCWYEPSLLLLPTPILTPSCMRFNQMTLLCHKSEMTQHEQLHDIWIWTQVQQRLLSLSLRAVSQSYNLEYSEPLLRHVLCFICGPYSLSLFTPKLQTGCT